MSNKRAYVDISGSMAQDEMIAQVKNFLANFDGEVFLFETVIYGPYPNLVQAYLSRQYWGGGTDFLPVIEHIKNNPIDEVIVVTDGYAPDIEKFPGNVTIKLAEYTV